MHSVVPIHVYNVLSQQLSKLKCWQSLVITQLASNHKNKAVTYRRLCPRSWHLGNYFKHTSFSRHYNYMHGHHVQARCHKYSTRPLRPNRLWLQEVVLSVRCLQRVFLRANPKAAYVWASLPQPGGDVEQPISLCANMTSFTKAEIGNISLRRQRRTELQP